MRTERTEYYGACGLTLFYDFTYERTWNNHSIKEIPGGAAGHAIAAFINTAACRRAYKEFAERFPIVFQSEVRQNTNSGNQFFFCVYDTTVEL